jgi:hypothetical protein
MEVMDLDFRLIAGQEQTLKLAVREEWYGSLDGRKEP